jgi:hypothetical protein
MNHGELVNEKRIKFRSISSTTDPSYGLNRVEEIYLPNSKRKVSTQTGDTKIFL